MARGAARAAARLTPAADPSRRHHTNPPSLAAANPRTGTYFCVDKSVTAVVIQGLAEHKETLGAPLCPCRHYDDKAAEAANGFWNCPCVPMRERKVRLLECCTRGGQQGACATPARCGRGRMLPLPCMPLHLTGPSAEKQQQRRRRRAHAGTARAPHPPHPRYISLLPPFAATRPPLQECHCMLFLTEDNDFAGRDQHITHDEVVEGISGMKPM